MSSSDLDLLKKSKLLRPFREFKHKFASLEESKYVRGMTSFSDTQWVKFIIGEILKNIAKGVNCIVLLGSGQLSQEVQQNLLASAADTEKLRILVLDVNEEDSSLQPTSDSRIEKIKDLRDVKAPYQETVFVSCFMSNADVKKSLQIVLSHPEFRQSEFIFKIRILDSYRALSKDKDIYDNLGTSYVSSIFDDGLIDDIYEFSLTKVERKCEVTDAYDLYQLLLQTKKVEGAIAEFGSYKGHSGLIISEIAKRLHFNKQIYLCDAFEEFPKEDLAVDKFWNDSHFVNYEEVKKIFDNYENVHLVKGDFADTIDAIPENQFSLVYVDCDSYRAVKFVSEKIYPKLNHGGVIIYEDYGHDFCLGARQAVDEFYDNREGCFSFFSAFSGLQIVIKL
ncbi:TylF/MycF/NovP-related O-methyltransferase [Aerosakkonema sp. BLCC-F183]|uniref:TylF/MycF/NovP-related O-methyltransferase n=1 Tax=Aerosakkonema sp. BLCC-F183 TaxID=3342834 RepID=UPI0035BB5ACB